MIDLPHVAGVAHRDVHAAGMRFHVAEAGVGDPVVLLHGWPQHWWMWRHLVGELAPSHRVIAPDLPGFGWSDAPPGSYAKEELAARVLALVDALGLDRVALVGHDWGGLVAWLIALRDPGRVTRLAALDIVHPWLHARRPRPVEAAPLAYQVALGAPLLGERLVRHGAPRVVKTLLRRGAHPGFAWSDEEIRVYAEPLRRPAHARASSALYRTFLVREVRALAGGAYADRHLSPPVLLMTGAHDPVVRPRDLDGWQGHAEDVRVAVLEDCGHFAPEERPEAVLAQLAPFLAA